MAGLHDTTSQREQQLASQTMTNIQNLDRKITTAVTGFNKIQTTEPASTELQALAEGETVVDVLRKNTFATCEDLGQRSDRGKSRNDPYVSRMVEVNSRGRPEATYSGLQTALPQQRTDSMIAGRPGVPTHRTGFNQISSTSTRAKNLEKEEGRNRQNMASRLTSRLQDSDTYLLPQKEINTPQESAHKRRAANRDQIHSPRVYRHDQQTQTAATPPSRSHSLNFDKRSGISPKTTKTTNLQEHTQVLPQSQYSPINLKPSSFREPILHNYDGNHQIRPHPSHLLKIGTSSTTDHLQQDDEEELKSKHMNTRDEQLASLDVPKARGWLINAGAHHTSQGIQKQQNDGLVSKDAEQLSVRKAQSHADSSPHTQPQVKHDAACKDSDDMSRRLLDEQSNYVHNPTLTTREIVKIKIEAADKTGEGEELPDSEGVQRRMQTPELCTGTENHPLEISSTFSSSSSEDEADDDDAQGDSKESGGSAQDPRPSSHSQPPSRMLPTDNAADSATNTHSAQIPYERWIGSKDFCDLVADAWSVHSSPTSQASFTGRRSRHYNKKSYQGRKLLARSPSAEQTKETAISLSNPNHEANRTVSQKDESPQSQKSPQKKELPQDDSQNAVGERDEGKNVKSPPNPSWRANSLAPQGTDPPLFLKARESINTFMESLPSSEGRTDIRRNAIRTKRIAEGRLAAEPVDFRSDISKQSHISPPKPRRLNRTDKTQQYQKDNRGDHGSQIERRADNALVHERTRQMESTQNGHQEQITKLHVKHNDSRHLQESQQDTLRFQDRQLKFLTQEVQRVSAKYTDMALELSKVRNDLTKSQNMVQIERGQRIALEKHVESLRALMANQETFGDAQTALRDNDNTLTKFLKEHLESERQRNEKNQRDFIEFKTEAMVKIQSMEQMMKQGDKDISRLDRENLELRSKIKDNLHVARPDLVRPDDGRTTPAQTQTATHSIMYSASGAPEIILQSPTRHQTQNVKLPDVSLPPRSEQNSERTPKSLHTLPDSNRSSLDDSRSHSQPHKDAEFQRSQVARASMVSNTTTRSMTSTSKSNPVPSSDGRKRLFDGTTEQHPRKYRTRVFDVPASAHSIEIDSLTDAVTSKSPGNVLNPILSLQLSKYQSRYLDPYAIEKKTIPPTTCLNRKLKKKATTSTVTDAACKDCENEGLLCIRVLKPGYFSVLPLQPDIRQGERGDLTYWIKKGKELKINDYEQINGDEGLGKHGGGELSDGVGDARHNSRSRRASTEL